MPRPTLPCIFRPQQWVNDWPLPSGPSERFDGGSALLGLTPAQVRRVVSEAAMPSGRDLDIIAEKAGLVGDAPEDHKGPFEVDFEVEDLMRFMAHYGFKDAAAIKDMTQEDLGRARDLHDTKRIRTTYEIVTEESAAEGEAEETGFEDEVGVTFTSLYDALRWLEKEGGALEASSSHYSGNVWYRGQVIENAAFFEDGESKTLSYHLVGFTEEEEEAVFSKITAGTEVSLELLFGAELRRHGRAIADRLRREVSHNPDLLGKANALADTARSGTIEAAFEKAKSLLSACEFRQPDGTLSYPELVNPEAKIVADLLCDAESAGWESDLEISPSP